MTTLTTFTFILILLGCLVVLSVLIRSNWFLLLRLGYGLLVVLSLGFSSLLSGSLSTIAFFFFEG
jgi:predicted membrane protein